MMNLTSCVSCPRCLMQPSGPVAHGTCAWRLKPHKDCRLERSFCSRSIYECPGTDFFFTHPVLTSAELGHAYSTHHTASQASGGRSADQGEFVSLHLAKRLSQQGRPMSIVEMGCSNSAGIVKQFGGPNRTLICYEPSCGRKCEEKLGPILKKASHGAGGASHHAIGGLFNASEHLARFGPIDLFLSSHVIEHLPDLCDFTSDLFTAMAPGGAVFTEVPNSNRGTVLHTSRSLWQGGFFHISLPTPRSMVMIMESAGFRLGVVETVACSSATSCGLAAAVNGGAIRSLFYKPAYGEGMSEWVRSWEVPKSWRWDVQGIEYGPPERNTTMQQQLESQKARMAAASTAMTELEGGQEEVELSEVDSSPISSQHSAHLRSLRALPTDQRQHVSSSNSAQD